MVMLKMSGRVRAGINVIIKGETAWIKYAWDGKYEKAQEQQLVQLEQLVPQRRQTTSIN
jgi:hypothetical protein